LLVGLPEGYVDLDRGRWRVVAARLELAEMVALLGSAREGTLAGAPVTSGRGGTQRVVLSGGNVVYVRRYLRGGAARYVVRDLYLLRPPRPIRELLATEQARASGCRVPIVHAVAVEERGPFYRGWIVTAAVAASRPFITTYLEADAASQQKLLGRAGETIRALHDAGVYHVDLNGHNLLVDAYGRITVIDFDRAVLAPPGRYRLGERGRDRFWRSLTKLSAAAGAALPDEDRRWLERGYTR
jgi:3-deoxy-D-manno-octulosonic acid kinase